MPPGSGAATFYSVAGSVRAIHVYNLGPAGTVQTVEDDVSKLYSPHKGSGTLCGADRLGSLYPLKTDDTGSYLMIAGSISSMPSVSVSAGSASYVVAGSVIITNVVPISGTVNQGTDPWIIAGSISSMPSVSVATGSEVWIRAGSVNQNTDPWIILGSVYTVNAQETGSNSFNYVYSGTEWIEEPEYRNVIPSGTTTIVGSVAITSPGSVIQLTNPWIVLGSVNVGNIISANQNGNWNVRLQDDDTNNLLSAINWASETFPQTGVTGHTHSVLVFGASGTEAQRITSDSGTSTGYSLHTKVTSIPAIAGSVAITNIGSVIQSTSPWIISGSVRMVAQDGIGSVLITNSISVAAGSQSYLWANSGTGYDEVSYTESGGQNWLNVMVDRTGAGGGTGSVQLYDPSGVFAYFDNNRIRTITYIASGVALAGSVRQLDDPWRVTGSMVPYGVGSIRIAEQGTNLTIAGSVNQGTDPWIVLGSMALTNIGSVIQSTNPWIVLGSVALTNIGSVIQSTNPWIILGSVALTNIGSVIQSTNPWIVLGSIRTVATDGIGSVLVTNAVTTYPATANALAPVYAEASTVPLSVDTKGALRTLVWTGVGSIYGIGVGSVYANVAASAPLPVSGTVFSVGSGTVGYAVNSGTAIGYPVQLVQEMTWTLGSPGYKQNEGCTSGTYINIWTPQTGSKIELHGIELSSQAAGIEELKQSGTALKTQSKFYIPNSGTVVKTFIKPIVLPVNRSYGIGPWQAGSWTMTLYGRETA
jgi:hypothetical protein